MRKRNNNVCVRFSDSEFLSLRNRILDTGLSLQDYLLQASLDAQIVPKALIDEWKALNKNFSDFIRVLRGIGINLNQIAHISNITHDFPDSNILDNISVQLSDLRKEADELWQLTRLLIGRQNRNLQ